jgi:MFS family permease
MVLVIAGIALLGTIDATTPLWVVGAWMAVTGIGLGATMQNLVLAVQNNTAPKDLGAASSVVAMFRSIGGSAGVAALGAVLAHQVTGGVKDGIARLIHAGKLTPEQIQQLQHSTGDIPKLADLPAPIRAIYEGSFGEAVGHLFTVATPFAVVAFLCILFIKEVPLRTTNGPVETVSDRGGEPELEAVR